MSTSTELVIASTGEVVQYDTEHFMDHSQRLAKRLDDVVRQQKLDVNIQGKRYLRVEAWQFLAGAVQMTPRTRDMAEVRNENNAIIGYRCYVELVRDTDGMVLGGAFGRCDLNERIGKTGGYAAESMAQTRATAKAISQKLRFIPVLAGYEGTPMEEVPKVEPRPEPPAPKVWVEGKGRSATKRPMKTDEELPPIDEEMDAAFDSPAGGSIEKVSAEAVHSPATVQPLARTGKSLGGPEAATPAGPSWLDETMNFGNWPKKTWRWLEEGECDGARASFISGALDKANSEPGFSALLRTKLEHAIVAVSKNPPKGK